MVLFTFAPATQAVVIGPGTGGVNNGGDSGTPTNIDLTSPMVLNAGTYDVVDFTAGLITSGFKSVQPFLTVGGPNNHTVVWVGPIYTLGSSGVHNVTYPAGTQQFTLASTQTVFGGVDSLGALVRFTNGGLTDHNSIVSLGPVFVGQTMNSFSFPNLNRTYHLSMTVESGVAGDPADLDGDGDVDDADFGIAFAAFTGPNNGPSSNPAADLDQDGDVDDADFGIAFAAFTGPGSATNVPEPAALAPLLLTLCVRRQRRVTR